VDYSEITNNKIYSKKVKMKMKLGKPFLPRRQIPSVRNLSYETRLLKIGTMVYWSFKHRRVRAIEPRQHSFSERVINLWKKLDSNIVCATTLNCFESQLQKLYKDESFHRLPQSI